MANSLNNFVATNFNGATYVPTYAPTYVPTYDIQTTKDSPGSTIDPWSEKTPSGPMATTPNMNNSLTVPIMVILVVLFLIIKRNK